MTNRTISANSLTYSDSQSVEACRSISNSIKNMILDPAGKTDFNENWGKVSLTRDAGAGRGAGKLQRDALCTRGKADQTPISNRNLRWHPLVVADKTPEFAREVLEIRIIQEGIHGYLAFVVEDSSGNRVLVPGRNVHELETVYCAPTAIWEPIKAELKAWKADDWGRNRCVIPALEFCDRVEAVQSFAALAISVASSFYDLDVESARNAVESELTKYGQEIKVKLPSQGFPSDNESLLNCPLCRKPIAEGLEEFRYELRNMTWRPVWGSAKRGEGEDSSLQIMHVAPLTELWTGHNSANVRLGHRWCNVAMTDHSLDETLKFFQYVTDNHD